MGENTISLFQLINKKFLTKIKNKISYILSKIPFIKETKNTIAILRLEGIIERNYYIKSGLNFNNINPLIEKIFKINKQKTIVGYLDITCRFNLFSFPRSIAFQNHWFRYMVTQRNQDIAKSVSKTGSRCLSGKIKHQASQRFLQWLGAHPNL